MSGIKIDEFYFTGSDGAVVQFPDMVNITQVRLTGPLGMLPWAPGESRWFEISYETIFSQYCDDGSLDTTSKPSIYLFGPFSPESAVDAPTILRALRGIAIMQRANTRAAFDLFDLPTLVSVASWFAALGDGNGYTAALTEPLILLARALTDTTDTPLSGNIVTWAISRIQGDQRQLGVLLKEVDSLRVELTRTADLLAERTAEVRALELLVREISAVPSMTSTHVYAEGAGAGAAGSTGDVHDDSAAAS